MIDSSFQEYCYDLQNTQTGKCSQRTGLYATDAAFDTAAQTFLNTLTSSLRTKLDALQASNGYSFGRYELTHAPMDVDLLTVNTASATTPYYTILKNRARQATVLFESI